MGEDMCRCSRMAGGTRCSDRSCIGYLAGSRMSGKGRFACLNHWQFPVRPSSGSRNRISRTIVIGMETLECRKHMLGTICRPEDQQRMVAWINFHPQTLFTLLSAVEPNFDLILTASV